MIPRSLKYVDFIGADGKYTSGLVPVRSAHPTALNIDEHAAIQDAAFFKEIDFVFFRRFSDGRSSQIAAYVVDNADSRLNEKTLADLHRKVWLHGVAPLLYVAWPSRIDILSCARGPDFWDSIGNDSKYSPAEELETAGAISNQIKKFSAFRLADGTFWEEPGNAKLANYSKAAHNSLIQAIVDADKKLDGEKNPTLRQLLLLMVLIKYLEDRRVFPNGWFSGFRKGAKTFLGVLEGGAPDDVYGLLDVLERKFNGDVFALPREGRQKLTKKALSQFAELVEARTQKQQRCLWEQYSFEHLPVEIISHLYQRFVKGGHGAVYTPPFLASMLLDRAMPYTRLTGKERVLDPACGSGVFLVGAFRRLITVWRSLNGWRRPGVTTLKELLRKNIYGVELDQNAVHLTAFSLSLAICDALQPDVIWKDLKFDPLHKTNLLEADFFQILLDSRKGNPTIIEDGFDIVVGNPPFESKLSDAGTAINNAAMNQNKIRGALPDKNTAYLFLEQALSVLRPGGSACLIQPSGLLYNSNVQAFRTAIFQKHEVETIFDFTSIRQLYDGADPKTVAVLAKAPPPTENHWIDHRTFRRTVSVLERICFEIDHYDHHRVPQKEAEGDPYVWRANLLGGGRLREVSKRLRNMRRLAEYLSQQKEWDYGEGFITGNRKKRAPFLTGMKLLPTEALTSSGIEERMIGRVEGEMFEGPRNKNRFTPPLILIKELDSLPVAYWDKGFLAYGSRIVGIHAPKSQTLKLQNLYNNFLNKYSLYQFFCTLHSTELFATTIRKQDIDILPYPEDMSELSFSYWEDVLRDDVLKYMTEYVRLGQNSALLLNVATNTNLKDYSGIFFQLLGSVYDNLKVADPIFLDGLICQPFYFGNNPNLSWLANGQAEHLRKLIYKEEHHKRLRTIRVLRYYSENVILLVKPDRLRYWIQSTAIRDADETLVDLRNQGW